MVAIARYCAFIVHALHLHPQERERLAVGGEDHCTAFVNEVRRYYPFFPMVAARVRRPCV